jgi:hypothetical protein
MSDTDDGPTLNEVLRALGYTKRRSDLMSRWDYMLNGAVLFTGTVTQAWEWLTPSSDRCDADDGWDTL